MPKEPRLAMLPDKDLKLSGSHFRRVVRRIESIVPIAGDGIEVEPVDGGHKITAVSQTPNLNIITLNVCSNGTPSTIQVYGPLDPEAFGV
jgi:hypothetical protein